MKDYSNITDINQLRAARSEIKGALASQRRAVKSSWEHLRTSYQPDNLVRAAFRGVAFDFSETLIGLAIYIKDVLLRKFEDKKNEMSEKISRKLAERMARHRQPSDGADFKGPSSKEASDSASKSEQKSAQRSAPEAESASASESESYAAASETKSDAADSSTPAAEPNAASMAGAATASESEPDSGC